MPQTLDQNIAMEIEVQVKTRDADWREIIIDSSIITFEISYDDPVSYFKHLENW
jgi:hypothetical protein